MRDAEKHKAYMKEYNKKRKEESKIRGTAALKEIKDLKLRCCVCNGKNVSAFLYCKQYCSSCFKRIRPKRTYIYRRVVKR